MDPETDQENQFSSNNLGGYIITILVALVCFVLVVMCIVLFRHKNQTQPSIDQQISSSVTSPTQTTVQNSPLQINPSDSGVTSDIEYLTLSGRIDTFSKSGDNYLLTLISATGKRLVTSLIVKEKELGQLGEFTNKTSPLTPILISSLKSGDLVDVSINNDLKRKVVQVTSIIRYNE